MRGTSGGRARPDRRRARWCAAVVRAAAASLALLALLALTGCGTPGDGGGDAALVFCLSPLQRARLIEAGTTLGPAVRGVPDRPDRPLVVGAEALTVEEWRRLHPGDFDRACAAIAPSTPPQEPVPTLTAIGTAGAGAVFALLTALVTARVTRRGQLADSLRDTAQGLAASIIDTAGRRGTDNVLGVPSALLERAGALDAALLRARSATRPGRRGEVDDLIARTRGVHERFQVGRPHGQARQEEQRRAAESDAGELRDRVESLAARIDPWHRRRRGSGGP